MGYFNPIYRYGAEAFVADAKEAGVDGLIVVDLPPEEDEELRVPARSRGARRDPPRRPDDRRRAPAPDSGELRGIRLLRLGHRHYRDEVGDDTGRRRRARANPQGDRSAGRGGVRRPQRPDQAAEIAGFADAVVVGSAIVQRIESTLVDGRGRKRNRRGRGDAGPRAGRRGAERARAGSRGGSAR